MSQAQHQAAALFEEHGGVLRTKDALQLGIHPRTLYRMRHEGVVQQLSRGLYRLTSLPPLAHPDLVTVALRVPQAVICLISALAYHDVTNEIPHEMHIALPRGARSPRLAHPPVRVFRLSGAALTDGIDIVQIDGVDVRVYNLSKTVVDCFRFRNKLGIDVAVGALREAIHRKRIAPAEILRQARRCRAAKTIAPYIEALQ